MIPTKTVSVALIAMKGSFVAVQVVLRGRGVGQLTALPLHKTEQFFSLGFVFSVQLKLFFYSFF